MYILYKKIKLVINILSPFWRTKKEYEENRKSYLDSDVKQY